MSDLAFRQVAARHALDRRRFLLRSALGLGAAGTLSGFSPLRAAMPRPRGSKVVVVTFGGGARDAETFAPEGQANIPHMLTELIPSGHVLRAGYQLTASSDIT